MAPTALHGSAPRPARAPFDAPSRTRPPAPPGRERVRGWRVPDDAAPPTAPIRTAPRVHPRGARTPTARRPADRTGGASAPSGRSAAHTAGPRRRPDTARAEPDGGGGRSTVRRRSTHPGRPAAHSPDRTVLAGADRRPPVDGFRPPPRVEPRAPDGVADPLARGARSLVGPSDTEPRAGAHAPVGVQRRAGEQPAFYQATERRYRAVHACLKSARYAEVHVNLISLYPPPSIVPDGRSAVEASPRRRWREFTAGEAVTGREPR